MGSASGSRYPWGESGNYWGWVDRRARALHDCAYCGAKAGEYCVTLKDPTQRVHRPHAARVSIVEAEARKIRIGDRG